MTYTQIKFICTDNTYTAEIYTTYTYKININVIYIGLHLHFDPSFNILRMLFFLFKYKFQIIWARNDLNINLLKNKLLCQIKGQSQTQFDITKYIYKYCYIKLGFESQHNLLLIIVYRRDTKFFNSISAIIFQLILDAGFGTKYYFFIFLT